MTIGERIRALRELKGESLSQTALSIGTTKPHLWDMERGHTSNPDATDAARAKRSLWRIGRKNRVAMSR